MSEQQNVQIVREAYASFKQGNIPDVLEKLSEDIDWFLPGPPEIVPVLGRRRGRQQVAEFFRSLAEHQDIEEFEAREFIAQGDKVVVLGNQRWRVKSTGRRTGGDWAHVFTLGDGKITKFEEYFDTHDAVQAYSARDAASAS